MKKVSKRKKRVLLLSTLLVVAIGFWLWLFFFTPHLQPHLRETWRNFTREGRRILGWGKSEIPLEEKRIREEVILKKMEEANAQQDWRALAPEYPSLKKTEAPTEEERMKALRSSPEFKEIEKEWNEYVRKKEDSLLPEAPVPSPRETGDWPRLEDKATQRIIGRLLASKEKIPQVKPLEENLRLGMKGPLASRKMIIRPPLPQVHIKIEAEVEMTLWVLPNGTVDRVIPSMKGDMELERIAIQYLKQWRFAPLMRDQPQVEQWGTIPIKFRLQ